jgi:hypothetical protein
MDVSRDVPGPSDLCRDFATCSPSAHASQVAISLVIRE